MDHIDEIDEATRRRVSALAREMEANGKGRDSAARSISGYLGDRWSSLILLVLNTGTWRHAELRRMLGTLSSEGAISQRVLTLKLRSMERDGLVDRTVTGDVPPRVSYRLSALGAELVAELRRLLDWSNARSARIMASRQTYDRTE